MKDKVKKDCLYALKQTAKFLRTKDALALGKLSNWTIDTAGVFQDEDSVSIAVATYALFKIVERYEAENVKFDPFIKIIEQAVKYISSNDLKGYRQSMKDLFSSISSTDKKLRFYVQKVIHKAKIHRGSFLHAHGISVARTAQILGLSQWQLMDYVGQTRMIDKEKYKMQVNKRLEITRSLFR